MSEDEERAVNDAIRVIDQAWQVSEAGNWLDGLKPVDRLPQISEEAAFARSTRAQEILAGIEGIDRRRLPHDLSLTLGVAHAMANSWAREGDWYWIVFDPTRAGVFAPFAPTPYSGAFLLQGLQPYFSQFKFQDPGDVDRYAGLIADYGRIIRQFDERTKGQEARGIFIPQQQLEQSRALVLRLRNAAASVLDVADERLEGLPAAETRAKFRARVESEVEPAFDALLQTLHDPNYASCAPTSVGLSQYQGGADIYEHLVRLHLTLDMTPEQVHASGLTRMADIKRQMAALFSEIGYSGDAHAYLAKVMADPRWRAHGPEAVASFFERYIDRIAPHIETCFAFKPTASHGVAPLAPSLEATVTFGYYQGPTAADPTGRYVFNAANLSNNTMCNVAALNFHELVPGHHFHLATQRENKRLHPLRRAASFNAFAEGWAEYAATLAGELGMYAEPEERFGRLMSDAFLTCRLVVDTGMNAFGWSLDRARAYIRENGFMPEAEIASETLRYSCGIPGQALAYKLGDTFLMDLRAGMQRRLGSRFDIRDFHDAVLRPGALPLPLVKQNVEAETARLAARSAI